MLAILKKFFNFCDQGDRRKLRLSMILGVVKAFFAALRIPAIGVIAMGIINDDMSAKHIWGAFAIMCVSVLGQILIGLKTTMLQCEAGYHCSCNKRMEIAEHLRYLPMGYFNQNSLGRITNITTNTMEGLADVATRVIMMTTQGILTTAVITIMIFCFDWRIGVILLIGVAVFGVFNTLMQMSAKRAAPKKAVADEALVLEQLRGIADGFLLHNRDIQTRCDDSLCRVYEGREYFIRRSRGYVPFPIKREINMGMLLACGSEQKASFSLSKDDYVFPCQHIGDLKNLETLSLYEAQISHFERLFDIAPRAIACDLHPDYMSSEYAGKRAKAEKIPLLKIQHHHAHMASCMADNSISGDVIGIIWDGTGLGTDGTSWGGEFLTGGFESFERVGHIRPIKLIGGDKAAEEISRTAFYMLKDSGCDTESIENSELYSRMLEADINCPVSTGMGRLFDGVASIIGIKSTCSYEGQGAILLEAAAAEGITDTYTVSIKDKVFDWRNMVREIYSDLQHPAGKDVISAKFMNTIIHMAVLICRDIREEKGLNRVCLSGGTFQNMYILRRLPKALKESGLEVYTHRRVSCNDEGLSLGQIAILNEVYNVSGNSFKTY